MVVIIVKANDVTAISRWTFQFHDDATTANLAYHQQDRVEVNRTIGIAFEGSFPPATLSVRHLGFPSYSAVCIS
ncbi:hypothetical protein AB0758_45080 [Tolypothrix bouteillei VB521301_2]|uniref:hypothetical protein n=1 Tax=Tolypothrix bouteillei TaxID=1246981 RepID=UPI0038B47A44